MYFHYDQIAEFIVNARTPFLFLIYKLGSIDSEVLLAMQWYFWFKYIS